MTEGNAMNWYLAVLKKYAVFTGRARRKEYWMFCLYSIGIAVVLGFIEGFVGGMKGAGKPDDSILAGLYQIAIFVPSLAVGWRRMHDTNRSGWWICLPIANLIFATQDGQQGMNRFGADPKAVAA
jgi:uncharacterized membrane protein YhaH (DUF805 family)